MVVIGCFAPQQYVVVIDGEQRHVFFVPDLRLCVERGYGVD